jgi:hypothetical protein
MNNKAKGAVGCITCGTSIGCFFPLTLLFGTIFIVGGSSYFDSTYLWEETDTWLLLGVLLVLVPAIFVGILQAVVGAWSLAGIFNSEPTNKQEIAPISYAPISDEDDAD